jgi:hypothetical protein
MKGPVRRNTYLLADAGVAAEIFGGGLGGGFVRAEIGFCGNIKIVPQIKVLPSFLSILQRPFKPVGAWQICWRGDSASIRQSCLFTRTLELKDRPSHFPGILSLPPQVACVGNFVGGHLGGRGLHVTG